MTIKLLGIGRCCLTVLVVTAAALTSAVVSANDVSYKCTLSDPIEIDDGVTLEHVKNVHTGTYTMRWTYNGGQAWIGVGINTEDSNKMTPGMSVIGRVVEDEEGTTSTSVYKYSLESDAKDGSGVVKMGNQNLMDASFVQSISDNDDGTSTLMFTQLLEDDGVAITDESSWIYAIGLPDNQWEGKHKIHGSFQLSLNDGCVVVTKSPTPLPTPNPTPNPTTPEPTTPEPVVVTAEEGPVRDFDLSMNDEDQDDNNGNGNPSDQQQQEEEELQQEDEAFEEDIKEEEEEEDTASGTVFVNPTSTNTVVVSSASGTTTTTTAAAATGSSSSSSGFIKKQDVTEETHALWKAHGWTLTVAWGLLAPLAVGVSILRHTVGRFGNTSWYNLHFYMNLGVVGLTVVGFLLAVAATQQEEKPHFQQQDDTNHHPVGLVIIILVVGQSLWGYFRPPAPKAPPSTPAAAAPLPSKAGGEEDTTELALSTSQLQVGSPTRTTGTSSSLEDSDDSSNEAADAAPPMIRKIWEIQHRLTGVCILAMAWYNCHSGYQLMEENYDDDDNHTTLFWGVTGAIGSLIFVLSYGFKMR